MDSPVAINKDYQKRRDAMKHRLTALGKSNPVVAKAMKNQEPPQEDTKWKNWNIVDELVSAARREYFDKDGGKMGECLANLASALSKLASKKPIDTKNSGGDNSNNEDDY